MEYVVFALALAVFVVVIFIMEAIRARKEKKEFIRYLYEDYDKIIDKKYPAERFEKMGSFYRKHPKEGQIDDITWNDLGMDDIFKRMNYTLSASGEEYLYYVLRTPQQDSEQLEHLEDIVAYIGEHPDERVRLQLAISRLGYMGKYSLYDYLDNLELLGERSNRKNILMDLLFLPCIGLLWVNFSVGILGIVLLTIYNILTYFREKAEIDPYITSFSYIMRLLHVCGELEKIPMPVCGKEWEALREGRKQLQGMRQNSYWVMSPQRGNASGDILAMLMDYIRMIFHVDLMKFNSMLKVLRGHMGDVDGLIQVAGYMETAVSIWAFRQSLQKAQRTFSSDNEIMTAGKDEETADAAGRDVRTAGESAAKANKSGSSMKTEETGWCVPIFDTEAEFSTETHHDRQGTNSLKLEMKGGYHPLLKNPVKNDITACRGVLLTGSNASGKSTFLKTAAINAILAQTIHTCTAESCRTPFFRVYTSMALRDDIVSGESYYIVEIKALKRILDAASAKGWPVLCFVDEVLRGTNTIERIAASTQILKSFGSSGILCFAATHDIELTELLQGEFDNYHFEEDVRDGDVFFNYKLQQGRAVTRNAIKLLALMGYKQEIIEKASAQAERFALSGVWSAEG